MQNFTPCLWFDSLAEEAVDFYVTVFRNSEITGLTRYTEAGAKASGKPVGTVMTVAFQLDGNEFLALNGGPEFKFTPAVSFIVNCETQEEINRLWEALSEGGAPMDCGWIQDKYGVSWQIVPRALGEMLKDKDLRKIEAVLRALMGMKRLDMDALRQAYEQG